MPADLASLVKMSSRCCRGGVVTGHEDDTRVSGLSPTRRQNAPLSCELPSLCGMIAGSVSDDAETARLLVAMPDNRLRIYEVMFEEGLQFHLPSSTLCNLLNTLSKQNLKPPLSYIF
jgi:hypothetical protein